MVHRSGSEVGAVGRKRGCPWRVVGTGGLLQTLSRAAPPPPSSRLVAQAQGAWLGRPFGNQTSTFTGFNGRNLALLPRSLHVA